MNEVKLPKSIIGSVRRARKSAITRREMLDRKIEEFETLLRQYGENIDDDAPDEQTEGDETEQPDAVQIPRRRRTREAAE